ncbi:hypothetical protein PPL_09192 [Heterostelium album PN500]|uniref:Protein kinase domain-containing protein n=1 Tax=Heterostelium pallidum (strain ATCC 26659 / Pp 5 / PN500) TaxID=670386 RepID=D3BKW0_HETP5|nr:hypothetical protein PPL_09192 [Heterostelium album PN500]EFA78540.1 hypothetical protein PPL_09192 [Heterostelium album PN500]|eukprot:XP_020430664.1 hypothetical protein PPL_09192 [Heterostelium album PN500]
MDIKVLNDDFFIFDISESNVDQDEDDNFLYLDNACNFNILLIISSRSAENEEYPTLFSTHLIPIYDHIFSDEGGVIVLPKYVYNLNLSFLFMEGDQLYFKSFDLKTASYDININFDKEKQRQQQQQLITYNHSDNINSQLLKKIVINNSQAQSYYIIAKFRNSYNKVLLTLSKSYEMGVYKSIIYRDSIRVYEGIENEIKAMELLKGKSNFVQLIDHFDDKPNQTFHMVTEFCNQGDLSQLFNYRFKRGEDFQENQIWQFIMQMFDILKELEEFKIVHCDIKPSNIFIKGKDLKLVLGDFGCCIFTDKKEVNQFSQPEYSQFMEHQDKKAKLPATIAPDKELNSVTNIESEDSVFDMEENNDDIVFKATRGTKGYIAPYILIYIHFYDQKKEVKFKLYYQPIDIYSIGSTILKLLSCSEEDKDNHEKFKSDSKNIVISKDKYTDQLIEFVKLLLDDQPKNRESVQLVFSVGLFTDLLEELLFGDTFNQIIEPETLPKCLRKLVFGRDYNQPLVIGSLPNSLETLVFGFKFNQLIQPKILPPNLKELKFGRNFNQPFESETLPPTLRALNFGGHFNRELLPGFLPQSIKSIRFGKEFNQPIIDILPTSLKELKFSTMFNQQVPPGILPPRLKTLKFGNNFNQPLPSLPKSLLSLALKLNFNHPIQPGVLPESLEELKLSWLYNHKIPIGALPKSLLLLKLGDKFNQPLERGSLPDSIKFIKFREEFNQPIDDVLPKSLKTLVLGKNFNKPLQPGVLPPLLEELAIGECYNQTLIPGSLPDSLKRIQFGNSYTQVIDKSILPTSLEGLQFGDSYNNPVQSGSLPETLTSLVFGHSFNQPILEGAIPSKVEYLEFGDAFNQPISQGTLPNNLKELVID